MKLAAEMLGKHLETVKRIYWDIEIDAELRDKCLTRCYYVKSPGGRQRWSLHESLVAGQVVGINCAVPDDLSDDDFWSLLQLVGRYKGISPWKPGQYGHFDVVSIKPRRNVLEV